MKRDIKALSEKEYDVAVIGCGIYGAAIAREAVLRGLSTVVIDKNDFCGATSANSLKIVHGGLRYLQQVDLARLRESVRERRNMMKMAPHLVHPLPCAMPTYGHFMKGPEVMFAGLTANNILSCDRNKGMPPDKIIPSGEIISRPEWLKISPDINNEKYNGAALWTDAYAFDTERVVLGMVRSAVEHGADAANYVEVTGFKKDGKTVTGLHAKDLLSGEKLSINAKLCIVSTGPWIKETLSLLQEPVFSPDIDLALAVNFIFKKQLSSTHAVGLSAKVDASGSTRLYFFVPWRGRTLAGTYYKKYDKNLDAPVVTDEDIVSFLSDLNKAYPSADLKKEDISFVHIGVLPAKKGGSDFDPDLLKHYSLTDHAEKDGVDGVISLLGVKYTTARDVAEKTINCAVSKLAKGRHALEAALDPIPGGEMKSLNDLMNEAKAVCSKLKDDKIIEQLVCNYGAEYQAVFDLCKEDEDWMKPVSEASLVIGAEVIYAVREEMAQTLLDICLRRTGLASVEAPDAKALEVCANLAAHELGWDGSRIKEEIDKANKDFSRRTI